MCVKNSTVAPHLSDVTTTLPMGHVESHANGPYETNPLEWVVVHVESLDNGPYENKHFGVGSVGHVELLANGP